MSRQSRTRRPAPDAAHPSLTPRPFHQDVPTAHDPARNAGHDFRRVSVFPTAALNQGDGGAGAMADVPVAAGGGEAMPDALRASMEASFAQDFSDVRVHTGPEARQVGALAYTRGSDIHFQPGQYDPAGLGGQELLGHELAHVVQQRAGRVSAPQQNKSEGSAPINADSALEAEADALGAKAARGERASVSGAGSGVQRKAEDAPIQRTPEEDETRRQADLGARATSVWTAKGGGDQDQAGQTADWKKAEAQQTADIGRLAQQNWWGRHTDKREAGALGEIQYQVAPPGDGQKDVNGKDQASDWADAEKAFQRDLRNQERAKGDIKTSVTGAGGVVSQVDLHQSGTFDTDKKTGASAYTPIKQHVPDPRNPGKIEKSRQDLLKSQLVKDGRAGATEIAPGDRAKAIKDSPVEALIKAGKDEKSPEVIAARAEKSHQDAVGTTGLGKKSTVSGIDEVKHEAQAHKILENMELGVNQNKLADKMKATGKTQAEIDTALYQDPLAADPKAKDAAGLETEIDAHNAHYTGLATAAFNVASAASLAGGGSVAANKAAGTAAAAPHRANTVAPAHFIGRHGAQTTSEDQIMRLAAGVAPDKKPAAMPANVPKVGGAGIGAVSLPDYATAGKDTNATSSSRFSSHGAQLFAMEEAFAQATNAPKQLGDHENLPYAVPTMKRETRQLAKYTPGAGGALMTNAPLDPLAADPQADRDAKAQRNPQNDWVEDNTIAPTPANYGFDRDSARMAVNVGPQQIGGQTYGSYTPKAGSPFNTGAGMGDAFNLVKPDPTSAQTHNPKLPDLTANAALPTADLDKRLAAVQKTTGLDGTKVILDQDTVRGGFTPQTAFPTSLGGAMGGMTQDYTSTNDEVKAHRTGAADQLGKVEVAAPIPSIVGATSTRTDEDELTANLARIKGAGNFVWDNVAKTMVQTPYTK